MCLMDDVSVTALWMLSSSPFRSWFHNPAKLGIAQWLAGGESSCMDLQLKAEEGQKRSHA